jgi:phage tail-like protein
MPYKGNDRIFKHNYIETIKKLVPDVYLDTDISVSGTESDIAYEVLGKIILAASEHETFFNVSARDTSATKAFFIPRNRNTRVSPSDFSRYVLSRYEKDFSDFKSSGAFINYITATVLPDIHLNIPASGFVAEASADVNYGASDALAVHEQLLDNLGLAYILNTSSTAAATTQLSSILASSLATNLYYGKEFTELEGLGVLFEYCWRNREASVSLTRYVPPSLTGSASSLSSLVYASGTQHLERFKTYLGVWLDPSEEDGGFIENSLTVYEGNGTLSSVFSEGGSLGKFLKAVSYAFYDLDKVVEELQDLFDIDYCPDEFLGYLANMVGWKFLGEDISLWRGQLRQAIYTYKAKGTRKALSDALSYVFPQSVSSFNTSSDIHYTFESYLPYLLYYALKTESDICKDPDRLYKFLVDQRSSNKDGLRINISNDYDTNIRFCVDALLEKIHLKTKFIDINGVTDLSSLNGGKGFEFRRANLVVPPWEKPTFYKTSKITLEVLDCLYDILKGNCNTDTGFAFDIRIEFLDELITYIKNKTTIGTEGDESLVLGNNNFFRFYTFSSTTPPNFSSVISDGKHDELSVIDYWNTRSSNIFIKFPENALTGDSRLKISNIRDIANTVYEFTPLHVMARLYVPEVFSDEYEDQGDGIQFTGRIYLDDDSVNAFQNYTASGWLNTSGDPSSWIFSGNGDLGRTTGRRKNFRYVIDRLLPDRQGKSMPISMVYYSSSALESPELVEYFAPKGFNFISQSFVTPDGGLSSIYDTSNSPVILDNVITQSAPDGSALGVYFSAMFPVRGYSDLGTSAISPEYRTKSGGSAQTFYDITLRKGRKDSTKLVFNELDYISTTFGLPFHSMWTDYRTDFSYALDGSGFCILDHAYGPGFYNSCGQKEGIISDSSVSSFRAYAKLEADNIYLSSGQFQRTIGGRDYIGQAFRTQYGELIPMVYEGIIQDGGYGTYQHEIERYFNSPALTNESFLSGVQVVTPPTNTQIVVRSIDELVQACDKYTSSTGNTSITIFGGRENANPENGVRIRYPLTKERNNVINGDLTKLSKGDALSIPIASSISNWNLYDKNSSYYFSGTGVGSINLVELSSITESPVSAITLNGASGWAGILTNLGNSNTVLATTGKLKKFIPGSEYTLSYEASSYNTSAGVDVYMFNRSQDLFLSSDGAWVSSFAVLSSAPTITNGFYTVERNFSIPVSAIGDNLEIKQFASNDDYVLGITNHASSLEYVKNISIVERYQNRLFKDSGYRIDVSSVCFDPLEKDNFLGIRILAYSKLEDGDIFAFSKNNRWEKLNADEEFLDSHVFKLPLVANGKEQVSKFKFHTINEKGPLDKAIRQPLYINGGSKYRNVHGDSTEYFIEFIPILEKRTLESDADKPYLKVMSFSFINELYEGAREDYIRSETKDLFEFFDGLKDTSLTRESSTASSLGLGVSGGSRIDYIAYYGGEDYIGPNTQGYTVYEI